MSDELIRSILAGKSTTVPGGKSKYNPHAVTERLAAQSKSPLLIEAIKRRLLGDRIGGPLVSKEDAERLRAVEAFGNLEREAADLARRRADIRQRLEGRIGFIQKAILRAKEAGIATKQAASAVIARAKDIIDKLKGDTLARKLEGFGLLPKSPHYALPIPRGQENMLGVSSSNVASIGWEPHYHDEDIRQDTLGTLFIEFTNSWKYRYVNAPHWLYEGLLRAPSKGKAVWGLIRRGLYPDGIPYGSASREGYERIQ